MVRANEHVQYEVPNERTRVGRLLKSVQANHLASVAAAKTTIEATHAMRTDFEQAADFLILNAPIIKSNQNNHRISALNMDDDHGGKTLQDLDHVRVEDRFYDPKEYNQLSNDQKAKLRLICLERNENDGKNGKGKSCNSRCNQRRKKNYRKFKEENEELKQRIAALESNKESNKDDSKSDDESDQSNNKKIRFNQRSGGRK